MSTAVICSFCLQLTACEQKIKKPKLSAIKIGVQSDLLSFDPFSFQSLGEKNVTDLLYDKLFYFEGELLKSDLQVDLELNNNSLRISGLKPKARKKVRGIFLKARSSVLWKEVFAPFEFSASGGPEGSSEITYSENKNFISNLKTLSALVLLEGDEFGAYKITGLKKGISLSLEVNTKWQGKGERQEKIVLKKVKTISAGLKQLSIGELDVFVPFLPSKKSDLEPYDDIKTFFSENKGQKLRLYSKFGEYSHLYKTFCSVKLELSKTLEKSWTSSKDFCGQSVKTSAAKNLKVILGDDYGLPLLDLLARAYLKETGRKLDYEILDGVELSKKLKAGEFDHYLSVDVESPDLPVPFDSFHSSGRYNSYKLGDKKLDKLLEKVAGAKTAKEFKDFEQKSRTRLKTVLPLVFEYSRPQVEFFKAKKSRLRLLKSSKTLMKFQN